MLVLIASATFVGNVPLSKKDLESYPHKFDVRKFVHHHTIQINYPTRCNSFTSLLLDVYVWFNMFRALPRPSSGAYRLTCQTTTKNAATATLQQ
jgi:hypothetical protein